MLHEPKYFRFETIGDFAKHAATVPSRWQNAGHASPLTYPEVITRLAIGDLSHVDKANGFINQINTALDYDSVRTRWTPSVTGAYPVIPDYLAGQPNNMRIKHKSIESGAPITLWIDLTSSAGVSLETLQSRGIACLALAMYLQTFRPVQLNVMVSTGSQGGVCVAMDTTPFDISSAANFLCNGETARLPMYAIIREQIKDWLVSVDDNEASLRKNWLIPQGDIVLCGTHLYNEAVNEPISWINDIVTRAKEQQSYGEGY